MSAPAFQQFGLFDGPARAPMIRQPAVVVHPLRPYQLEAVAKVASGWAANRSQLVVMPTGTGKTRLFSEIAKTWRGRILVIAHREELISQGREDLQTNCGELISTEKAELRADGTRIVIGSVPTLSGSCRVMKDDPERKCMSCGERQRQDMPACSASRLALFARRHPATLVICDEAHHAVSPSYRTIFDAFPDAKVLGVTATPDRSDERAMGQVFDEVAFVYEIQDAIRDKWLCPIRVKQVMVGAIDLSGVGTVAGDLNQGELDAVMQAEEVLHGMVKPMIELAGERLTIAFCTSVDGAHRAAEICNRYKPDSARAVDGTTATDTRKQLLRDHNAGRYQFLFNVGIATEGYNSKPVSCIAMMRPTKSRALYAQCAGRGLRTLLPEGWRPDDGKPDCLLLDFVGNSGKHALVSALDILAGKYDDEVIAKARDVLEDQGMDGGMLAEDALERAQRLVDEAKAREAAKRARLKAKKVDHVVIERDPFALLDVQDPEADKGIARYRAEATEGQIAFLTKKGVPEPEKLSKRQASGLIGKLIERQQADRASYKMLAQLKKRGVPNAEALSFIQAKRVLDAIAANGWRPLSVAALDAAIERAPGEEG